MIGGTNQLLTLSHSSSRLTVAANEGALTSEMFVMLVYGYANEE
jgi:hypothetical protein